MPADEPSRSGRLSWSCSASIYTAAVARSRPPTDATPWGQRAEFAGEEELLSDERKRLPEDTGSLVQPSPSPSGSTRAGTDSRISGIPVSIGLVPIRLSPLLMSKKTTRACSQIHPMRLLGTVCLRPRDEFLGDRSTQLDAGSIIDLVVDTSPNPGISCLFSDSADLVRMRREQIGEYLRAGC